MSGAPALLVGIFLLAACSGDPGPAIAPTSRSTLPPDDADAVAAIYREELDAIGVRLTRAGLVDRTDGQFEYAPDGTHLALYVEPVGEATTGDYVDRILSVAEVFASTIFERWPGLETFDVCQEPPTAVDDTDEPDPFTQVTMRRDAAQEIDWETATLADLLVLAQDTEVNENGIRKVTVSTNGPIASHPEFEQAREAATLNP